MPEQNFNDLSHKVFQTPAMLIECGILPVKGKMILGGEPKIGKSLIVLRMLRDMAQGLPLWGVPDFKIPTPLISHYFEQEIGEQSLQARMFQTFDFVGVPMKERQRVWYTSKDTAMRLDDPNGIQLIHDKIKNVKADVTIFDPISKFHLVDENSAQEIGMVGQRLDYLTHLTGAANVMIHHLAKQSFDAMRKGAQRLRGSSVFFADVDTAIIVDIISNTAQERKWKLQFQLRHDQEPDDVILRLDKPTMEIYFDGYTTRQAQRNVVGANAPSPAKII